MLRYNTNKNILHIPNNIKYIIAMIKTIKLDEVVHSRLIKHGLIGETFQEL